jgi:type IV secretory pathway component VirB8
MIFDERLQEKYWIELEIQSSNPIAKRVFSVTFSNKVFISHSNFYAGLHHTLKDYEIYLLLTHQH